MKKAKYKPKPKIKKKDEDNFDYMKTNKDNLKKIIKDDDKIIMPIINDLVNRTNKIVIRAYQFIKLYCIYQYTNNIKLSLINKQFISEVFVALTIRTKNTGKKAPSAQLIKLIKFYNEHYKHTIIEGDNVLYDKLSYILPYEAIAMVTNINNNIVLHYISHLNKYVNVIYDVKNRMAQITAKNNNKIIRKQLHNDLYAEIQKIKDDLMCFNELSSDTEYHDWIIMTRQKLYPNKTCFDKNQIKYDIKSKTQDYLVAMFYIYTDLEKINETRPDDTQIKLFNVLPLRNNIIPKNICIDTSALINNFLDSKSTQYYKKCYKEGTNQSDLWHRFFTTNKRVFKKGSSYKFHHMIRTDGISCSIIFIRLSLDGKPLPKTWANKKCCAEINTDYIENVLITEELMHMKVVCADPGHSDLIYYASKTEDGRLEIFRYTQNQRRHETRLKKYGKIINKLNNDFIIEGKTVIELETQLSFHNSKTCSYDKFVAFCTLKNKINNLLLPHYTESLFRKLKLNRFINTQKSESKLIKNFSNKFGGPKDVIFVMGDYDKGSYNMRGLEPTICKKFRRLFHHAGYKTFLVNEFRTSKLCNYCHDDLDKFHYRPSKKPKLLREGKTELCHGLLRCQSNEHCSIIHNRDKNAAQNMLYIVQTVFSTGKRPAEFRRGFL